MAEGNENEKPHTGSRLALLTVLIAPLLYRKLELTEVQ